MKVVKIKGGLGNQMFQYAFALYLKRTTGVEVLLDFSYFGHVSDDKIRQPRLLKYNISNYVMQYSGSKLNKIQQRFNSKSIIYKLLIVIQILFDKKYYFQKHRMFESVEKIGKHTYFDGYWQSYKYVDFVKEEIISGLVTKQQYTTNLKEFIKKIQSCNSVFVGVRKGDYTKNKKSVNRFGLYKQDYYDTALKRIEQTISKPTYYVFSNDIKWVHKNLDFGQRDVVYIERELGFTDFEEFILMQNCKNAIIVNSTFHWWAAWLIRNKDKKIICPKSWYADGTESDICPNNWIRI